MTKTRRIVAVSLLGHFIEWYDFGLFGYMAPVFSRLFFPHTSEIVSLLEVFGVFALGYLFRPFGAILFGQFGDRIEKRKLLRILLFSLCIPGLGIALLPTYHDIGIYATLLLILMRSLQGLCIGAEFSCSMVYITENSPIKLRAFISGLTNNGSNIGLLFGVALAAWLARELTINDFYVWGWRIPFFLGGMLGFFGFWLRKQLIKSKVFHGLKRRKVKTRVPMWYAIRHYPKPMFFTFLLVSMSAVSIYTLTVYLTTYLHIIEGYSLADALTIQMVLLCITLLLVPLFGMISDIVGRRFILTLSVLGILCVSIPCFKGIHHADTLWTILWLLPLVFFVAMEQGVMSAAIVENFPARVRYSGISVAYNLSFGLIGGTAPLINTWLIKLTASPMMPAYYLMFFSIFALIAIKFHLGVYFGGDLQTEE